MNKPLPPLSTEAADMIRELCCAVALSIDKIANQAGLQGYQDQLAELFIYTFETIQNKVKRNK